MRRFTSATLLSAAIILLPSPGDHAPRAEQLRVLRDTKPSGLVARRNGLLHNTGQDRLGVYFQADPLQRGDLVVEGGALERV